MTNIIGAGLTNVQNFWGYVANSLLSIVNTIVGVAGNITAQVISVVSASIAVAWNTVSTILSPVYRAAAVIVSPIFNFALGLVNYLGATMANIFNMLGGNVLLAALSNGLAVALNYMARMNSAVFGMFKPLVERSPLLARLLQPLSWLNPTVSTVLQSLLIISTLPVTIATAASAMVFSYRLATNTIVGFMASVRDAIAKTVYDVREQVEDEYYYIMPNTLSSAVAFWLVGVPILTCKIAILNTIGTSIAFVKRGLPSYYKDAKDAAKNTRSFIMNHQASRFILDAFTRPASRKARNITEVEIDVTPFVTLTPNQLTSAVRGQEQLNSQLKTGITDLRASRAEIAKSIGKLDAQIQDLRAQIQALPRTGVAPEVPGQFRRQVEELKEHANKFLGDALVAERAQTADLIQEKFAKIEELEARVEELASKTKGPALATGILIGAALQRNRSGSPAYNGQNATEHDVVDMQDRKHDFVDMQDRNSEASSPVTNRPRLGSGIS